MGACPPSRAKRAISGQLARRLGLATMLRHQPRRRRPAARVEHPDELVRHPPDGEPTVRRLVPPAVAEFEVGEAGSKNYLVGQVMKATQGKADPKLVNDLLTKKLTP